MTKCMILIFSTIILLCISCGTKDESNAEPGTEQPAAEEVAVEQTVKSPGEQRYAELRVTVQDIIQLLKSEDDRGVYDKYVKPSELERIDREYGGLDSALTNFRFYRNPLRFALEAAINVDPEFNEDTTEAIYRVEASPGPVKFIYMNSQWYFNPKEGS